MKKVLIFSLVAFLSFSAMSQQKKPVIAFTKLKHNFGNIRQENGPAKVRFEFTNTGGSPLIIKEVKSSCGCTTPSWSRAPIAPGGKGFVEAVYNPLNRPGSFSKTITVTSNTEPSSVILSISGNVLERQNSMIQKFPQKIGILRADKIYLNYGNLYSNETKDITFELYNPTEETVNVEVTDRDKSKFLSVKFENKAIKANSTSKVVVTIDANKTKEWDYLRGFLYLTINGNRASSERLNISAIIKERFGSYQLANPAKIEFTNTSYDFGTVKQGDVVERIFKYKNTGVSKLIIRKTRTSCGCTAASLNNAPVEPGKSGEIKVRFNTSGKMNHQTKTITVITNCPDPKMNKIILRLTGTVEAK